MTNAPSNPHISDHAIGTTFQVKYNRHCYTARLARREFHGEEWRIETDRGGYVFSTGYRDMTEHRINN
jgi:hypothetical protein